MSRPTPTRPALDDPTAPGTPRLAVLISGGGRTLHNILDHIDDGRLGARVAVVVASKDTPGARLAEARGVPLELVPGTPPEGLLSDLDERHGIDGVVLAGYLKKLCIPRRFDRRVINIHPSLLPVFGGPGMYGERVHAAVLAAHAEPGGPRESGCTVHLCDGEYDTGEVLAQSRVPIEPGDTPQTLAARVFEAECKLYPRVIGRWVKTLGRR